MPTDVLHHVDCDRMPGEPPRAWAAYLEYLNMGPRRTLDAVGWRLHKSQTGRKRGADGCIRNWAKQWRWKERAAAWDGQLEQGNRERAKRLVAELGERHAAAACLAQAKAVERLQSMDPHELSPANVLAYLTQAIGLERIARGVPAEIEQHHRDGRARNQPEMGDGCGTIVHSREEAVDALERAALNGVELLVM